MKITIVSLRDCAIYLEAHTLRMCRLVSSIFKIDKTGAILPVQIADEEFRSRLKQLDISLVSGEKFSDKGLIIKHQ